ncbi:MAG TPA: adenine phosphoribosyltransferase [Flavobacteriaceae bacterium]|nr:adenine phosphoribosyltransferase [Flavobacteriaceae bacterium]
MFAIEQYIRNIPDFPKKGVQYKDITPLLLDPKVMEATLDALLKPLAGQKIDKVVGVEARGFLFGILLAKELNAGFVPIRKPGKLPYDTISATYDLEYGTDSIQVHTDAILPGEKVLMHDDVLATGGTASAACSLIERLGGEIVACNFILELKDLKGREKLKEFDIRTLVSY